jgi:hypothetical protein
MKVWVIFECSIDGDSLLVYGFRAVTSSITAAVHWIIDHPCSVIPTRPPAHPLMTAANNWTFIGSCQQVDLLDQQSKAGDFGYVVEEVDVV